MACVAISGTNEHGRLFMTEYKRLSDYVADQCSRRLRAYEAQPRDANEHYGTEIEVLSGGYAYRQLYELVQNAADAIHEAGEPMGKILVRLEEGRILVANTGAPLDEDGIYALLNARSSQKRGGQIGRFGIGFKSLLKLGGIVDIVSRSVGLRFEPEWCRNEIRRHLGLSENAKAPGMRLAKVIDPNDQGNLFLEHDELSWATTIVDAEITDKKTYSRLLDEIENFPQEFVLFLEADVEITLEGGSKKSRVIQRRRESHQIITSDGVQEERWRIFERMLPVTDRGAKADALDLHDRDEVPLVWAVPLDRRESQGRFWAFFPTNTPNLTAGILNAPWKVNSDRTNIIPGPWNDWLMQQAALLIADSLEQLATVEDPGAPLMALPRLPDRQTDPAVPLAGALWDLLVDRSIVADGSGKLRSARNLYRHPIDDLDAVKSWQQLAHSEALSFLVHPSCTTKVRNARLEALQREIQARSADKKKEPSLQVITLAAWLEFAASRVPDDAIRFFHFLGGMAKARLVSSYRLNGAQIIPTVRGALVTPEQAVIGRQADAPAGFSAVEYQVAGNEIVRNVLIDFLQIKEIEEANWQKILNTSFNKANDAKTWTDFWRNIELAPEGAVTEFFQARFDYYDDSDFHFRAIDGNFHSRDNLIISTSAEASKIDPSLLLDKDWHKNHWQRLPIDFLRTFAPMQTEYVSDWKGSDESYIQRYFRSVKHAGWMGISGNPKWEYLDILELHGGFGIEMPRGWRLLPKLSGIYAAKLTEHLLDCARRNSLFSKPITYGHTTRQTAYTTHKARHPVLYWLNEFGSVSIGGSTFPIKCMGPKQRDVLNSACVEAAAIVAGFYEGFEVNIDLDIPLEIEPFSKKQANRFWSAIFAFLSKKSDNLSALQSSWETAALEGYVPKKVPTLSGALTIDQIYVGSDGSIDSQVLDDGRVVCLSGAAAKLWHGAGARRLSKSRAIKYEEKLNDPQPLEHVFPELLPVISNIELVSSRIQNIHVVWAKGLVEKIGPLEARPLVVLAPDNLMFLSQERFGALSWEARASSIFAVLQRNGFLHADYQSILEELSDCRASDLREAIRNAPSLEERLLQVVGSYDKDLWELLPEPVRNAAGRQVSGIKLAKLALAVLGPSILSKLRDVMQRNGLNPPAQWGGSAARNFALELGFPVEFASSERARKDPEILISGPIRLPPLHDYQQEIFDRLEDLLASSKARRRAIVSLPTGGGKTRVAAEAVVRLALNSGNNRTALWVAQTDELCEQAVQCFRQLWANVGTAEEDLRIIRLWGGQTNPVPPEGDEPVVVVASIQTLNSRLGKDGLEWLSKPGFLVIDECHHAITPSYSSLLRWLDVQVGMSAARETEPPVIGLSATPWRSSDEDESRRLAARFDNRWFPPNQHELHDKLHRRGVLSQLIYSPIKYDAPIKLTPEQSKHFDQYKELPDALVEKIGQDAKRNDMLIQRVLASKADSILLFANTVKHAQYLAARLHLAGVPAAAVSSETDRLSRQHFIKRFKAGDLRVLCNFKVLTTGFDAPKADMIIISRPVFSPVSYMQMVGRGLRGPANGGTTSCTIATVEDNILNYQDQLAYHFCQRFFQVN